jgi:predicted transport protein
MNTSALDKAYQTQITNIEKNTGKKLSEWISIINKSGLSKHKELVDFLKEKHEFTHGNANMVVHYAKQSHSAAVENTDDLVADQYKGKDDLKNWYDILMKEISAFGKDVEISPKKAYVSLRRKTQFAILQPSTKTRLDIGLNLKNTSMLPNAEAAGSWNSMCTHRIKIESEKSIDKNVINLLKQAYEQAG